MHNAKQFLSYACIASLLLLSSSCFGAFEEILFRKNGSGHYSVIFEMKGLGLSTEALNSKEAPEALKQRLKGFTGKLEEIQMLLEETAGISDVNSEVNLDSLSSSLSFDFRDVQALNSALHTYAKTTLKLGIIDQHEPFFIWKKKKLLKRNNIDFFRELLLSNLENPDDEMYSIVPIFRDMYVASTLRFDRKIKSSSNGTYKQKNDEELTWKKYIFSLRDEDKQIGNLIKLK